jgi:hypothetical protein
LGKEFLLFQILRDDFLSFLIRACWLVSFFFTPIYMFILSFVVVFGPKKGVLTTYLSFWNFKKNFNYFLLVNFYKKLFSLNRLNNASLFNYQFTIFTSRTTIYVLFIFWCFFFFFGESLLLILFNFSTLTDSIPANFFFLIKTHTIFYLNLSSFLLSSTIMFYILFFTFCAFIFLINLRYTFNYNYLNYSYFLEILFMALTCYLFFSYYLFMLLISYYFLKFITK